MARNTQVAADHNAPPITQILANFGATHPSRGWSDAADHCDQGWHITGFAGTPGAAAAVRGC